jgi:N utilization substance protein A
LWQFGRPPKPDCQIDPSEERFLWLGKQLYLEGGWRKITGMMRKARTEFAAALNQVCSERGIEPEVVAATIKEAILAAYKRDFGFDDNWLYEATIDETTGETRVFAFEEGKEEEKKELTPPGFGRIAAQVAKQVLLQKIREAEKTSVLKEYAGRVGSLISGMILRFDGPNVVVDIGKTEALMPMDEQVRSEQYRLNQRLTFYLEGIHEAPRGQQVIVSRSHTGLVAGLFRREVPEVASGAVEIRAVAREPGSRTKIAVFSTQAGVDPVGACVGQKGVRVITVINELGGEKLDVIQYNEDVVKFITAALSPAEEVEVKINSKAKTAVVHAPDSQLSLAIGKLGQNVRLAAKLTGYKIEIKENISKVTPKVKPAKISPPKTPPKGAGQGFLKTKRRVIKKDNPSKAKNSLFLKKC